MRARRGFTLVELLVSIVLLGLVMSSVLMVFSSVLKSYEFHQDISEAKQRGQIALSAIQPYVLNAGLALPNRASTFQEAFNQQSKITPVPGFPNDVKNFRGAVQPADTPLSLNISGTDTKKAASALWLVYSVPTGAGVNYEYEFQKNDSQTIDVENFARLESENKLSKNSSDLRAWISFPSGTSPLNITAIDSGTKKITLNAPLLQKIAAFDEIHYVRAVKIHVNNNNLYVRSLLTGADQPIIEGIAGLWCTYDEEKDRVLSISVLSRGSTRHNEVFQTEVSGWPADAPQPTDLHYRYTAVTRSWRMRN